MKAPYIITTMNLVRYVCYQTDPVFIVDSLCVLIVCL